MDNTLEKSSKSNVRGGKEMCVPEESKRMITHFYDQYLPQYVMKNPYLIKYPPENQKTAYRNNSTLYWPLHSYKKDDILAALDYYKSKKKWIGCKDADFIQESIVQQELIIDNLTAALLQSKQSNNSK